MTKANRFRLKSPPLGTVTHTLLWVIFLISSVPLMVALSVAGLVFGSIAVSMMLCQRLILRAFPRSLRTLNMYRIVWQSAKASTARFGRGIFF